MLLINLFWIIFLCSFECFVYFFFRKRIRFCFTGKKVVMALLSRKQRLESLILCNAFSTLPFQSLAWNPTVHPPPPPHTHSPFRSHLPPSTFFSPISLLSSFFSSFLSFLCFLFSTTRICFSPLFFASNSSPLHTKESSGSSMFFIQSREVMPHHAWKAKITNVCQFLFPI